MIIIFCRLLQWPLSKIRQPTVIAEVIGGILLGPTVMGRIPGFTQTIFPSASIPALTLVANVGLVLFLFLVGLEVDLRLLFANWKVAISVGALGMAIPFGLGCAIAYGLYHQFHKEPGLVPISFGTYMLFVGVAMAITVSLTLSHPPLLHVDFILLQGKWCGVLTANTGISRALSHLDGAQASNDSGRYHCTVSWNFERYRRLDPTCGMRCVGQRSRRPYSTLGAVGLRRLCSIHRLSCAIDLFVDTAERRQYRSRA